MTRGASGTHPESAPLGRLATESTPGALSHEPAAALSESPAGPGPRALGGPQDCTFEESVVLEGLGIPSASGPYALDWSRFKIAQPFQAWDAAG